MSYLDPSTQHALRATQDATSPLDRLAGIRGLIAALESDPATLAAVRRCEPAPPPAGSKVPAWLRAVVQRGLSRAPADRYPSMAEIIE